ncbi:hypothetical protein WDU94_003852 [Cyamophila willieti]
MNEKKNGGESFALCAVKIVYRFAALTKRFATLTCHRCCYYVGKNVRYAHVSQVLILGPKSVKILLRVAFIIKCIRILFVHF